MKKGDVVTFREVKDKGDENAVMVLEENPDGGRVLVRHLVDMNLQPTSVYPVSDLKLAFGVSSEDVFLALSRFGMDITMADADDLFQTLDAQDRGLIAKKASDAGVDLGEQAMAAQEMIVAILTQKRMKCEVVADVLSNLVPAKVGSFSELHNFVDANCYGGFCDDKFANGLVEYFGGLDDGGWPQPMIDFINEAQGEIDAWIKRGELKATVVAAQNEQSQLQSQLHQRTRIRGVIMDVLKEECDGTYGSDNPENWNLALQTVATARECGGQTVAAFIDKLSARLESTLTSELRASSGKTDDLSPE